jgi:hypothetical protein
MSLAGIHHYQTEDALTRQLAGRDEEGGLTPRDLEIAKPICEVPLPSILLRPSMKA